MTVQLPEVTAVPPAPEAGLTPPVAPPVAKPEEKKGDDVVLTMTQAEFNAKIAERLARENSEKVAQSVAEQTKELTERLKAMEDKNNAMELEKSINGLASTHKVDADLLRKSKLTGADLETFAKDLSETQKALLASPGTRVNLTAASSTTGSKKSVAEHLAELRENKRNKK